LLRVLIGEDDFSIRQSLEEIKKTIGDQTVLAANTTVLDGQVTMDRLQNACETVPFLAEKRLVIVEGLLSRFESGGKTGRRKTTKANGVQEECQAIADYVGRIPDFTELVLIDGKISNNNLLFPKLAAVTRIRTFPPLNRDDLRRWILKRVNDGGGSISSKAIDLLVMLVGSNLWVMAGEVDKLVLFVGGRRIEDSDVRAMVGSAQEASVFAMVDAILEFRIGVAEEYLQALLKQGAAPAFILVMLSRQLRMMVRVKEMRGQKKTRKEIQTSLGLTSDFVLRKVWEQTERYSLPRLKQVYHKLLETDLAIKTGKYNGDLALDILTAELGQRDGMSA